MYTNPYSYMYIHALHTSVYMVGVHVSAPPMRFSSRAPFHLYSLRSPSYQHHVGKANVPILYFCTGLLVGGEDCV